MSTTSTHCIWEKADISTSDISKSRRLTPKLSRLINKNMCFGGWTVPLNISFSSWLHHYNNNFCAFLHDLLRRLFSTSILFPCFNSRVCTQPILQKEEQLLYLQQRVTACLFCSFKDLILKSGAQECKWDESSKLSLNTTKAPSLILSNS